MSKTVRFTFTLLFTLSIFTNLFSQASEFASHEIVVIFSESASQNEVDEFLNGYNLEIIDGPTPYTQAYLLQVIGGVFPSEFENLDSPINGVVEGASGQSTIDGAGLNFNLKSFSGYEEGKGTTISDWETIGCNGLYNLYPSEEGDSQINTAIFDTGILFGDPLADEFFNPSNYGYNFVDPSNPQEPLDNNNHGSHVSSVVFGSLMNQNQNIQLTAFKTHDANGNGKLFDVIKALDHSIDTGENVINMSFSYVENFTHRRNPKSPMRKAVEMARDYGILIVASAGNNGINNDGAYAAYPASFQHDNIIATASMDCNQDRSDWSNYGPVSVDVFATGENVLGLGMSGDVIAISGTSQANAYVSRLATYLGSFQPVFNYAEVKCAILSGVTPLNSNYSDVWSDGYINPENSLSIIQSQAPCTFNGATGLGFGRQAIIDSEVASNELKFINNSEGIGFMVDSKLNTNGHLIVSDLMGTTISNHIVDIVEGENLLNIELYNDNALNIYFARLEIDGEIHVAKFIK